MNLFARYWTRLFHRLRRSLPALCAQAALVLGLALGSAGLLFAQSGAGTIQGTVTDPSGAVIPHATVNVVNKDTGVSINTTTSNVGFYQVPDLFTGTYTVTVTAPSMKTYKRVVDLLASQNAVINATMTTGAVTQQVQVSANAVQLITPDSGVVSSTLENARINQLPMNGRNLITLVQETTPGLESCSQSSSCPNGLMGQAMEYVADGADLSNREFGGTHTGSSEMPDPDSVQEVHVETSGSGAQYATPATAVLTTKSGTNHIHGSLFETARNNAFGIARQRQNPSDFVAPPYIRNEFGASAGGPIFIPHLYDGKNKSFWFFSYERYSLRSFSYQEMKVPTVAMRQGDFSGLVNSSGVVQQLYDPNTTVSSPSCNGSGVANTWCRTPFANNQIDPTRESPTAKIFNDITALPSNSNNPLVTTNLNGKDISSVTTPNVTFRLDQSFNQNNRAYLRFTNEPSTDIFNRNDPTDAEATIAADGLPAAASNISIDATNLFAGAIGFTHIFSPTFFSETVASQSWFGEQNEAGGTPLANFEKQLGLPNNFGEGGFPYIESVISPMDGTQFLYGVTDILSDLDENLTKTIGNHQIYFGGRYRHERFSSRPDEVKDSINFNGDVSGLEDPTTGTNYSKTANTGYADADEYLGGAYTYGVNIEPPIQHLHDMEFDAYIQDNWRVRHNLTLNLGVRYEAHPAIWQKYGQMEGFDLKNHAIVTAGTPAQLIAEGLTTQAIIANDLYDGVKFETPAEAGVPANTLTRNDNFTFGPRVGLAWQPFGHWGTVIRGAYGRYIYPEPIRNFLVSINRSNPFTVGYSMSYTSANQSPDGLVNYALRTGLASGTGAAPWTTVTNSGSGVPVMGANSANVVNTGTTTSILPGMSVNSLDPDFPVTYVTQTNFTIEQPLKGNSALRLSYLYTHGTNLAQDYFYNAHPSTFVWEAVNGIVPPTGGSSVIGTLQQNTYSSTATGPYDQSVYGGNYQVQKSGWSNDNIFQANYQRLFHHGVAYQIEYDWSKPFRIGSDSSRDSELNPIQNYATSGLGVVTPYTSSYGTFPAATAPATPPPPPPGIASYAYYRALNRFANYMVDTAVPKQHIQFNGIIDLPFGRGKRFLGNANRFLDELVGGFQLAGDGNIVSQDFTITSTHWGPTNPLHVYKHGAKITDCRSGNCYKAYEWFNGYIAPTAISGNTCSTGLSTVVSGLPSNWAPYQTPVVSANACSTPVNGKAVTDKYFGDDEANVTLLNGKTNLNSYQPYPTSNTSGGIGSNPFAHTVLNGPMNWTADLSLFKVFPITETTSLRFNLDAFNAFNVQGYTNPSGSDGTEAVTPGGVGASSGNGPRELQFTLRLRF
ncbi:MAG TPA: carboxypeptidase-like regulatory domain-containing protein [Terracidiphilus sp.]|jgi:hypothetical protein|nr:carboxypeptidase-like regulatory domain-containing protein [Terracidiphilus sp.]